MRLVASALQASAGLGDGAVPIEAAAAARLGRPTLDRQGCLPAERAEIVVCGRRADEAPVVDPELARRYARELMRAETSLGNGATGGVYLDSAVLGNGQISKRIMMGVKLGF